MLEATKLGPSMALMLGLCSYLVVCASSHGFRSARQRGKTATVDGKTSNASNVSVAGKNVSSVNITGHLAMSTGNGTRTAAGLTAPAYKLRLDNYMNVQYYGDFTVGGQTIPGIYDTGSFEVLVLSELCTSCRVTVPVYNAELSTTFDPGERLVQKHTFGSGPVLSKKGLETIRAGPSTSPLLATQQPFWQVIDHNIDVWNEKAKFAAIIGMGHTDTVPDMGNEGDPEPDTVMLQNMGINEFAICLEKKDGSPGWIVTGPTIPALTASPAFTPMNVVGQMHWGVKLTNVGPGGWDPCNPSCGAIIDSGTSLIAASSESLSALSGLIANIKEDCSNLADLPDLTFNLDGHAFALPPTAYVLKVEHPTDNSTSIWDHIFGSPKVSMETSCVPGFMQIDQDTQFGPMWIFGMPFLRQFYTVFDRTNKKMYAATADASCEPVIGGMFNAKRKRSPEDVTPTKVSDPKALRLPDWAQRKTISGKKFIF